MKWNERTTDPLDGAKGIKYKEIYIAWAIIAFCIIMAVLSGCAVTGQSVGVTHGFAEDGNSYHAPHYTIETERVDVGVQHYRFNERTHQDFTEVDWTVKF